MIKKILILGLLLTIGLPTLAVTSIERDDLFREVKMLCGIYGRTCKVTEIQENNLFAETHYGGDIVISTGMLNRMNKSQVRGVLYHEVGHVVLKHVEDMFNYLQECQRYNTCSTSYISAVRRSKEFQADRFATYVLKTTNQPEGLSEALLIITPEKDLYTTHPTHPSTADRINQIRRIYYGE